jgi:ADP-heptose:LPS heptosyltransferase
MLLVGTDRPVQRMVIVRALHLGDMLCAVPALRSLRAGNANAEITLVALPWARELVTRLAPLVNVFEEFPGFPGIPERDMDSSRVVAFLKRMQARRFDLAVQLHGSGSHINEFVALLGARYTAVFHRDGDVTPARDGYALEWPDRGSEIERLLSMPLALGCPDTGTALALDVTAADRAELESLLSAGEIAPPYACLHPGARFPSRRWAVENFAAVGDALAAQGVTVVLTGTAEERSITRAVRERMHSDAADVTGQLTLGTLAALVAGSTLVVCNDTGMSHVAAAVGARSVVVSSGSEVSRWAPLDARRNRVVWHDVACRPCMHEVCPTAHECANGVSVSDVLAHIDQLLPTRAAYA